jgi:hypothetical protein
MAKERESQQGEILRTILNNVNQDDLLVYSAYNHHKSRPKVHNRNKEEQEYRIFRLRAQRPLPTNADVGDFAIVFQRDTITGFYRKRDEWVQDTGARVGGREKLMHFPEKKWDLWVLHDPRSHFCHCMLPQKQVVCGSWAFRELGSRIFIPREQERGISRKNWQ